MTRFHLNSFGNPIPTEALPDALVPETLTPLIFTPVEGEVFEKAVYIALGYTHYEVMCVGAAGGHAGMSGGWAAGSYGSITTYGGGGGGGGMQIVSGALIDLPDICAVVVGQAGSDGAPGDQTHWAEQIIPGDPGEDGGFTTFGDDICQASGGKGGLPSERYVVPPTGSMALYGSATPMSGPGGDGGEGGVGGQTEAGGGAAGGTSVNHGIDISPQAWGYQTAWNPPVQSQWESTDGQQGSWSDDTGIGEGGGGGVGGTGFAQHEPVRLASVP